jgi:DNA-binding CsgD family transcriptional regulator
LPRTIEYPDRLLDAIYDSASEPELWPSVLTQIADLTGSQGGILFGQSFGAAAVYFDFNGRLSEECNTAYKARHVQNPWNGGMERRAVGQIVVSDEIISVEQLRKTLFYEEVLRPQDDVIHNAMVSLAARDDFRVAFNICRTARQGPPDAAMIAWMRGLVPHLRRSVGIGYRLDQYRALQNGQYRVLDRLSSGVILLDRRARLLYVNAAARALGSTSGALRLGKASVMAASPSHARELDALIRTVLGGVPMVSMSVPRPSDGLSVTILAVSVRGKDAARFADLHLPDAAVMLFIVDPGNRLDIPPAVVMDAFGLTRAEARVALAVSSGLSVPEVAIQLGLSPNTVKTHLRRVFAKTGTGRQAELVRLMTSIDLISGPGNADGGRT